MASNLLKELQKRRKTAEDSAKSIKEYAALLKAIKNASKLETALGALDKGLDAKDPVAVRTAYADYKPLAAGYKGQVAAEMTKLKKKSQNAEDTDAYADATLLVALVQMHEQTLPDKVQKAVAASDKVAAQMTPTGLLGEWTSLKRIFEAETGKKKPSESFLKVFRSSSGLENAFKAIDLSTKKNDVAALKKAYPALEKAVADYAKLVLAQAKVQVDATDVGDNSDDNQDPSYDDALKKLLQGLNRCRNEAKAALDSVE